MPVQKVIVEGKTVEDAINEGLRRIGKDRGQTDIEILQDARKGLFEGDVRRARVRLTTEGTDLRTYLEHLLTTYLRQLGLTVFEIDIQLEDGIFRAEVESEEDLSDIVGENGQTLNAMQHLAGEILRRESDEPVELILDADDFRRRRRQELQQLAQNASEQALEQQDEVELTTMIPMERKIIHGTVDGIEGVKSHSIGEDTNRRVVILPKGRA